MANYAILDTENFVIDVFVGRNESDTTSDISDWEQYYATSEILVKRTSYNTFGGVHYNPETGEPSDDQSKAFRKNYAGIGYTYNEQRDAFIPPKPFDSWVLNEETCLWDAPVPMPEDGGIYEWNEELGNWEPVSED